MLITISTNSHHKQANLVDVLLECHDRIRRFVELARRVATHIEPSEEDIAEACAAINLYFRVALPLHVADEEDSILSRLTGNIDGLDRALQMMTRQHAEHVADLDAFLAAVDSVGRTPRNDAHKAKLFDATARLEQRFSDHLELEETTIFPAVRELSEGVESEIVAEMRQRRAQKEPQ